MRFDLWIPALLMAALAGCGTRPATAPSTSSAPPRAAPAAPGPAASSPAAVRQMLASERLRLADLFRGTPVAFAMQADGSLRVAVPLRFSFDHGGVAIKPPLAAVLDRVARSQRNETTHMRLAAPGDSGAGGQALVRARATSTRDYLVGQGIAATRLTIAGAAHAEGVEILVAEAPQH